MLAILRTYVVAPCLCWRLVVPLAALTTGDGYRAIVSPICTKYCLWYKGQWQYGISRAMWLCSTHKVCYMPSASFRCEISICSRLYLSVTSRMCSQVLPSVPSWLCINIGSTQKEPSLKGVGTPLLGDPHEADRRKGGGSLANDDTPPAAAPQLLARSRHLATRDVIRDLDFHESWAGHPPSGKFVRPTNTLTMSTLPIVSVLC